MTGPFPPDGRTREAKAIYKTLNDYCDKFGGFSCQIDRTLIARMAASLNSGKDALAGEKRAQEKRVAQYDKKHAAFLRRPCTPKMEREYTALIKQRLLYEGACSLSWARYFEFRDAHPDCEPLDDQDLAYARQWTACALPPVAATAQPGAAS